MGKSYRRQARFYQVKPFSCIPLPFPYLMLLTIVCSITSFNEWGEGTQIEPATGFQTEGRTYKDYGNDPYIYLNITEQYTKKFYDNVALFQNKREL